MLTEEAIRDILEAGVWAPSAENRHVFRHSVQGASVRLHLDPALAHVSADQYYVALLSIGAVIENMCLAAGVHALDGQWQRGDGGATADVVVTFQPGRQPPDELAEHIKQRHTNRRPMFQGPRLHAAEQRVIEAALAPLGERWRVQWFDDKRSRIALCKLMVEAETHRFANAQLHQAMFDGIRFDVGWRDGASEGLPPATLQIEPGMRIAFAGLRHWPFMRTLARLGLHRGVAWRASYMPARWSPHLCVVTSRATLDTRDDIIEAGRAMQRTWLAATQFNLAVQPFAAAVALARPGPGALDESARTALVRGWQKLMPDAQPVMVFRLGYAMPPSVRAGRPAPAALAHR